MLTYLKPYFLFFLKFFSGLFIQLFGGVYLLKYIFRKKPYYMVFNYHNFSKYNNYKISILRTICKLNPYITVTAKELKIVPYRSKSSGTPITANQKLNVIRYAYQFKLDTISILKTSAAVDTIIAILLITSTTIGHTDLFAIRHIDFQSLIVNKFLAINRHRID